MRERGGGAVGKHFAGIGEAERIEGITQAVQAIEFVGVEHRGEVVAFLEADAVFAGDGAAHLDAHVENLSGQDFGPLEGAGFSAVIKNERMEIAVAGMKNVGAADAGGAGHLGDAAQGLAEAAAGHDAVLHDEIGREPADGAEGALAALPDGGAFGGVASGARFDGAAGGDQRVELWTLRGDDFARAFEFYDENGFAARRIFGVDGGAGGFERERVHDFDGAGEQAAGDDGGDGVTGLLEGTVAGEDRVKHFGAGQQL